jgi:hypothetical protein
MIAHAVVSQRLQFVSGPETHVFYACDRHRESLGKPWYENGLFFALPEWPAEPVDKAEEIECDYCRGEEGP